MDTKEIIQELALKMDLRSLSSFCRTSKRVNQLICNNNTFWVGRLKKDFNINFWDLNIEMPRSSRLRENFIREKVPARKYYYDNLNRIYLEAALQGDLESVKNALEAGAKFDYYTNHNPQYNAFKQALTSQNFELAKYLLTQGFTKDFEQLKRTLATFFTALDFNIKGKKARQNSISFFLKELLPYTYNDPLFLRLWKSGLDTAKRLSKDDEENAELYLQKAEELEKVISQYEN